MSPGPQAKIVDPTTGMVVPLGSTGEVLIRGYCVMLEYWGDQAKTDDCITKGRWYKTGWVGSLQVIITDHQENLKYNWVVSTFSGFKNNLWFCYWYVLHLCGILISSDIGYLDAFGYCRIEGRIKDMIIRGGENIYPAEIEQFLHKHPKIKEAQVSSNESWAAPLQSRVRGVWEWRWCFFCWSPKVDFYMEVRLDRDCCNKNDL